MTRSDIFSFIDFNETEDDPLWCPWCLKVGIRSKLQEPIESQLEQRMINKDEYIQCHVNFDHLVPIHEARYEGEYVPVVDMVDSPFDSGSQFMSADKRSGKKSKKLNRLQVKEDKDIAQEDGDVKIIYDSRGNY